MKSKVIPEGALIEVRMTIRLPCVATSDDVQKWLTMDLGNFGSLDCQNPLRDHERESWGFRVPEWRDTGLRGRVEESPRVKTPAGETWTTRYIEEPRQ